LQHAVENNFASLNIVSLQIISYYKVEKGQGT
jgi:hypothetical protein